MKRLLQIALLLAALAWCVPASAACTSTSFGNGWTCVQQAIVVSCSSACTSNQGTASMGSNITAGHQVIIGAEGCSGSGCANTLLSMTISDNVSDSFTASPSGCTKVVQAAVHVTVCYWAIQSAVGGATTFTINCNAGCNFLKQYLSEWSGGATSSIWDKDAFGGTTVNGTSTTCSGATTTNANDLWFSLIDSANGTAETWTVGAGYTLIGSSTIDAQEAESVTSTGTLSAGWSWNTTNTMAYGCGAIKAVSTASAQMPPAVF